MSFEVRAAEPGGEEAPMIGRFTDEEWWNLTALAHECGFDTGREHERLVYPTIGDTRKIDTRLAQQLYIGVSVILNQDVLPFATTWDSDDGHIHFRWVKPPEYGGEYAPVDRSRIGESLDFQVGPATLVRLREHLLQGPIRLTRLAEEV